MAITKPKAKTIDAFIAGAPDADTKAKGVQKGNKLQISLTIDPELLNQIDELAAELRLSRAGFINKALYRAVKKQIIKSAS
jgi:hypothetical protein